MYYNQTLVFIPQFGTNTYIFQMYSDSCQLISGEDMSPVNGDPESEVVCKVI